MTQTFASMQLFWPETTLVAGCILAFLVDLALGRRPAARMVLGGLAVATLVVYAALVMWQGGIEPRTLFYGQVRLDAFASFFKILTATASLAVVFMAWDSREIPGARWGDFLGLVIGLTLGMGLMASASHLVMIYLAVEFVSLASYVLAGLGGMHRPRLAEGALKYVVFGGAASGVMLYGMSLLYGLTGTLDLAGVRDGLATQPPSPTSMLAMGLVLVGLGYKIAMAPFHMWSPDVYEGAPIPFAGLLSVGPKAAGFALFIRFFAGGLGTGTDPVLPVGGLPWIPLVGILAAATMTIGNLTALNQDNVKRMLAFSSIAHAGYILMGVTVATPEGFKAVLFYLWAYLFMNLGAFYVTQVVHDATGSDDMAAFRGLGRSAPFCAVIMTVFLFSLTGLPPFAGFIGKFYLFAALLEQGSVWYVILALVGALNSAVSLYFYARIVKTMFLEKGDGTPVPTRAATVILGSALAIPVLALGLYWGPLVDLAAASLGPLL